MTDEIERLRAMLETPQPRQVPAGRRPLDKVPLPMFCGACGRGYTERSRLALALVPALLAVAEDVEVLATTKASDDRELNRLRVVLWQSQGRLRADIRDHLGDEL